MVFITFDRDAIIAEMSQQESEFKTFSTFAANNSIYEGISGWDRFMTDIALQYYNEELGQYDAEAAVNGTLVKDVEFEYADQIPPFNVTLVFANEYGQAAKIEFLDVEILNAGQGFTIDDVVMEMACTFICRSMKHMRPIERNREVRSMSNQSGLGDYIPVSRA